ncbi:hypothetical protein ANN_02777 [Periplaneta americana]|uniref:Uncharacterized protein n=1 Tax=Periplaneta americana TaxID=6978 RepID=A0ABQ8TX72_PERAM|nr:hypothetical protein ANN_02777 [Periplaneta americana]
MKKVLENNIGYQSMCKVEKALQSEDFDFNAFHEDFSPGDLDGLKYASMTRLRWAGHVARMGESRNGYRVLVGRPEGKRPLGRPRRRWEDNINMDLREVGYDDRDWINLAQDRDRWRAYVRAAMNLRLLNTLATDLDYMLSDLCATPPPPYENGGIVDHEGDIAHIRSITDLDFCANFINSKTVIIGYKDDGGVVACDWLEEEGGLSRIRISHFQLLGYRLEQITEMVSSLTDSSHPLKCICSLEAKWYSSRLTGGIQSLPTTGVLTRTNYGIVTPNYWSTNYGIGWSLTDSNHPLKCICSLEAKWYSSRLTGGIQSLPMQGGCTSFPKARSFVCNRKSAGWMCDLPALRSDKQVLVAALPSRLVVVTLQGEDDRLTRLDAHLLSHSSPILVETGCIMMYSWFHK